MILSMEYQIRIYVLVVIFRLQCRLKENKILVANEVNETENR